ncbi:MAG: 3-oxoacid CoA-transferase subunit B [bacterium]
MMLTKEQARIRIAKRVAQELNSHNELLFVNLGIGIPTLVADYVNDNIIIQSENGMLGVGGLAEGDKIDHQLINASRQYVMETQGCCYFDSSTAFGMIRGGHIDVAVLGAFEADQLGNVANWIIPGGKQLGVGGAMDLVSGAKKVIIAMQYLDKKGGSRVKKKCSLPVTGISVVDMIVTDMAVFEIRQQKLYLVEIAPELSLEDIRSNTDAEFELGNDFKSMED